MGIGNKLEKLIEQRCRNVNDVARATGITASTIYSIIRRDNTKADLDVLQKIADELSVTLDYFTEAGSARQVRDIAAHHDSGEWTEEELEEIENFKKYVLSKRKK